jgi:hypothetical protein
MSPPGGITFDASLRHTVQSTAKCNAVTVVIPLAETGGNSVSDYHSNYSHAGGIIHQKTVSENAAIIDNLKGGQNYTIQVRAKNVYGYGRLSDPLAIKNPECSCILFGCIINTG